MADTSRLEKFLSETPAVDRKKSTLPTDAQLRKEYAPSLKRELATSAEAAVRGFGKGATLGLSDHVAALVMMGTRKATGYGGADNTYENALRDVREQNKIFREEKPVAFNVGELTGGLALTPGVPGATLAGTVGRTAIMGGVQGAAGAETLAEIPTQAGIGTAIGAGTGYVGGRAGRFVSNTVEDYTRNKLASNIENMLSNWDKGGKTQYLRYIEKKANPLTGEPSLNIDVMLEQIKKDPKFSRDLLVAAQKEAQNLRTGVFESPILPSETIKAIKSLNIPKKEQEELIEKSQEEVINYIKKQEGGREALQKVRGFVSPTDLPSGMQQRALRQLSTEKSNLAQALPGEIAQSVGTGAGLGILGAAGGAMFGLDPYAIGGLAALGGAGMQAKQALLQNLGTRAANVAGQRLILGQPAISPMIGETAARAGTMLTVPTATEFYRPKEDTSRIEELLRRPKFVVED